MTSTSSQLMLQKKSSFLKRNINTKHPGLREAAYKTTVKPQVEHASSVWSPCTKKAVQRRATRLLSLPKCYRTSITIKSENARIEYDIIELNLLHSYTH